MVPPQSVVDEELSLAWTGGGAARGVVDVAAAAASTSKGSAGAGGGGVDPVGRGVAEA